MASVDMMQKLREHVDAQDRFIKNITEGVTIPGTIVAKNPTHTLVSVTGHGIYQAYGFKGAGIGTRVMLHPETRQIVALLPFNINFGAPCVVEGILPGNRIEVTFGGEKRVVVISDSFKGAAPAVGSTGLLDESGSVFMEVVAPPKAVIESFTKVKWDEIGGNDRAKRELQEAVTMIRGTAPVFGAYKAKAPKGVLLYGPPGCGKTMLGKAAATELGSEGFIYVKAPELLNRYVGASEERIRSLFNVAREHRQRTGQTAIIFIDEADAILGTRGTGRSSDMEKTIVPSFLTEMDGISESAAMVILATNRPDTIDPAIVREGRIDARILIDRPSVEDFTSIVQGYLKGIPVSGTTTKNLAMLAAVKVFETAHLRERVSGAMAATIVERAKREAIRRDVASKCVTGVTQADMTAAILEME